MKRKTPHLAALTLILGGCAMLALANDQMPGMNMAGQNKTVLPDDSGIAPRDPAKVPHRCDDKKFSSISDKIDMPPARIGKDPIDRGSDKGNPLCNHEVWQLIEKDKDMSADWNGAYRSVNYSGQIAVLKRADGVLYGIDQKVENVMAKAEDVFRSASVIGAAAVKYGDHPATVNPNRDPKDKIKGVTELSLQDGSKLSSQGMKAEQLKAAAAAIDDIATGGEAGDPAAKPPKPAKPAAPGKKIVAYLQAVEELRAALEGVRNGRIKPIPPATLAATRAIPSSGAAKAAQDAVATVFSDSGKAPGGALAYFDWAQTKVLAGYDKKVWAVYKQVNDLAGKTDSKTPGGMKAQLEALAANAKIKQGKIGDLQTKIKTGVLTEGGIDDKTDVNALPGKKKDFGAGAQSIVVNQGDNGTTVTYTPPGKKTRSVPVNPESEEDIQKTSKDIASDIAGGDDKLGELKGMKAAVAGTGADKDKENPGTKKPGVGNVVGPMPVTGLESGCGKGKTLQDAIKDKQDKRRKKDAKESKERQAVEQQYGEKLKSAETDNPLPERGEYETPADYEQRADVKQVRAARKKAVDEANDWYAKEQEKLGSAEKQSESLDADLQKEDSATRQQLKTQVYTRIGQLRTEFGKSDSETGEKCVAAKRAIDRQADLPGGVKLTDKEYDQITPTLVDRYFQDYWPKKDAGGNADEATGEFKKHFDWVYPSQVRVDGDKDVDNSVGRLFAYWLQDLHAKTGKLPMPIDQKPKSSYADVVKRKVRCGEIKAKKDKGTALSDKENKQWTDLQCEDVLSGKAGN